MRSIYIAVDNDDILFNFNDQIILFHNEVYGTNLKKEDFVSYNFNEVWGGTVDQAVAKVLEFFQSNYFKEIRPTEGSQKAMRLLKDNGHILFVVTGRIFPLVEQTEADIKKYFPNIFSGICFANTYGAEGIKIKKSVLCRRLNTRLIIEDDLLHINECTNAGITTLVYDYPWNQGVLPEKAERVFDWGKALDRIREYSYKFRYY